MNLINGNYWSKCKDINGLSVMDWTSVRQGKETWLQPSGEIQDKTRQDRTILED